MRQFLMLLLLLVVLGGGATQIITNEKEILTGHVMCIIFLLEFTDLLLHLLHHVSSECLFLQL